MAMQRNYFTVLFFLKKSKLLKNGEAPICMRITINGKRAEVQIKRSIIQLGGLVFMWKLSPPISPPVRCGILLQFAVWIKRKTADND